MKHRPKIIAISETLIRKNKKTLSKIDIPGYNCGICLLKQKMWTLLYISQDLKYKNRSGLNISQAKGLESSFIEAENKNRKKHNSGMYI